MRTKDYARWHIEKLYLNGLVAVPYCKEQEIWWMAIGCNIGYEEDGKGEGFARPVLILKKFNYHFILGLPLSSTERTGHYYYHLTGHPKAKTVLLSQLKAFDTRRLRSQFGYVSDVEFKIIKDRVKNLF